MKKIIALLLITTALASCEKESEEKRVTYLVSDATSEVSFSYTDHEGNLVNLKETFNSKEDIWQTSFEAKKGDIVYISAQYADSASSVALSILINGKVFKKATSNNDPGKFVTVSGTIPY